jgi:hypothetical protein
VARGNKPAALRALGTVSLGTVSRGVSAASGNVLPVHDRAEPVVAVVVPPDDVPADHAGLLLVTA